VTMFLRRSRPRGEEKQGEGSEHCGARSAVHDPPAAEGSSERCGKAADRALLPSQGMRGLAANGLPGESFTEDHRTRRRAGREELRRGNRGAHGARRGVAAVALPKRRGRGREGLTVGSRSGGDEPHLERASVRVMRRPVRPCVAPPIGESPVEAAQGDRARGHEERQEKRGHREPEASATRAAHDFVLRPPDGAPPRKNQSSKAISPAPASKTIHSAGLIATPRAASSGASASSP
jgi:hypothetical protein